jgi:hypothetical protein
MKDGEMQIVVPKSLSDDIKNQLGVGKDNEIKLSELTSEQIELLKSQRDALEGKTAEQMAQEMLTETKKMSNNLEAFVRSLAIQGKRQLLGKEGELLDGTDRIVPAFGEVLKTIKDLREDGLKMSQDPGRIGVAVKPIVDTVKEMGGYATGVIQSTKELIDVIRNEFIKGNETPKTKEQLKIEEENERRRERQKPRNDDGAFIGNLNIKLTKSGFGNDITIDQTEKGYLTPMRNMA